ncbi:MAG: integration host factor subunit beta [Nevskia sp.]|nr:integration host factor subunit beta [Nevskia sp.]
MNKSDLIESLAAKQSHLMLRDVTESVRVILDTITKSLQRGERVEVRGFGAFSVHARKARRGRNPKTGDRVQVEDKRVPHFKPGKELRERVRPGYGDKTPE